MPTNTQILLDHRPTGKVSPPISASSRRRRRRRGRDRCWCATVPVARPLHARRLNDARSYPKPQEDGAVMGGGTVGIVEASKTRASRPATRLSAGAGGSASLSDGRGLNVVDAKAFPIQAYLGPVGMPGVTAWYGVNRIIAPKAGETVLVSAATGAVGSVVGQLADLRARGRSGSPAARKNAPTRSVSSATRPAPTTSRRALPRS